MKTNMNEAMQINRGVLIKQVGKVCHIVEYPGELVRFSGPRVKAKQYAKAYAYTSEIPLYCQKASGNIVAC